MAGFKTHITFSSILGAGYGTAAYFLYDVPIPSCILAGGLCGVSGMLPDLDSGPGRPLHESMAFAAAVVPVMLIHHFQRMGLSHEMIIIIGAALYLSIRFGGAWLLQHFTVHRGMFHSLPAAAIFGEIGYLLASGDTNFGSTRQEQWSWDTCRICFSMKFGVSSGRTDCILKVPLAPP